MNSGEVVIEVWLLPNLGMLPRRTYEGRIARRYVLFKYLHYNGFITMAAANRHPCFDLHKAVTM